MENISIYPPKLDNLKNVLFLHLVYFVGIGGGGGDITYHL